MPYDMIEVMTYPYEGIESRRLFLAARYIESVIDRGHGVWRIVCATGSYVDVDGDAAGRVVAERNRAHWR